MMCWLPKKCFCFSLRSGTIAQGVLCMITGTLNILMVTMGLSDLMKSKIYYICFPFHGCYANLLALEKTLVLSNIIFNAFLYIFSVLLLIAVRNDNSQHMLPFIFVQGLVISGLVASAATALAICIRVGAWGEALCIGVLAFVYILFNIYLVLVVRSYYKEVKGMKVQEKIQDTAVVTKKDPNVAKMAPASCSNETEMTLEDYIF